MEAAVADGSSRSPLSEFLLAAVDRLRPTRRSSRRGAFILRFLICANLLALVVGVPSLALALARGQPVSAVVMLLAFMAGVLGLLAAIKAGVRTALVLRAEFVVLSSFLVGRALVSRTLAPEQLDWLVLLPLGALVMTGPRADDAEDRGSGAPAMVVAAIAVGLGALLFGLHELGVTLGQQPQVEAPWAQALNHALFVLSVCGLMFIYDHAVRESKAELVRLRQLLSVCAWCKQINDEERWMPIDQYVAERHRVPLTHGICPGCLARHFPPPPGGDPD